MTTHNFLGGKIMRNFIAKNVRNLKLAIAAGVALIVAGTTVAQTIVTIGTGTSNTSYVPVYYGSAYSYTQQLYTAAEIGANGTPMEITSIAFQWGYSSASTAKTNCTIYMANTPKATFSSTSDWVQYADMTPVYTGNLNFPAGAGSWKTFTLSTPFAYDGTSNLLVCVHDNSGSYHSTSYVTRYTSASQKVLRIGGSSRYNITGTFSTSGSRSAYRSNIRLTMQPLTCPGVTNLAISGTTLSWTERGTATQWIVEYGATGFRPGTGTSVVVNNTPSYSFSSLTGGIYDFYVRSNCGSGDTSRYCGPVTAAHNFTFCGGAGTQANPYLICNETDLRNLSTVVNAGVSYSNTYFRLVNNIAMAQGAFTPIGSPSTPFRGHFDGNGRSITNLTMSSTTAAHNGLFGMLIGGSIKNLTVGGTVAGGDTTGGIVGSAINSVISGCTNNATISGSYNTHGGIAGCIRNTKVLDCRNTGTIGNSGYYNHGGIVGHAWDKSAIRRCVNTGTVSVSTSSYYTGGIVGRFYNTVNSGDTVGVFACRNSTSIASAYYYTGGIVGQIYYGNVDSCYNTGAITGYYSTGGICGYAYYSKFRRCSNRANVSNSYNNCGGIVGYLYGSSSNYCYVQYCVNTGHISQTTTSSYYYTGGIVGYSYYAYIDYNTNSGDVLSNSNYSQSGVGGIVGYGSSPSYIRYNLNGGYIKSKGGYVGGIAGYGSSSYVTYNLNVNNVKGGAYTAAIAGGGSAATTNFWDKQMCPTTLLYGTYTYASCAKLTSELLGVATYPSTGFTAVANHYPIPTGMRDSLGSILAATPILLVNNENVNNVTRDFTVCTLNNVVWTSSNSNVISVSGATARVRGQGLVTFTGTVSGMQKHIWLINEPNFCGGSGTQADPYLICRHQTLDSLAMFVNSGIEFEGKYFKVVTDLDLSSYSSWRVIGDNVANPFKGRFDGNKKTISNLKITGTTQYRGLFGAVVGSGSAANQRAEIHDLTVRGSVSGGSYTGGIVGYADFTNFKNLHNYASVSTTSYSDHGGIAGRAYTYCEFDSCYNHAKIEGASYTGGIVGYHYSYGKITNCENDTLINSTSGYIGGIAGYYYSSNSSLTSTYEIRNCRNRGEVKGTNYLGGIVGYGGYCRIRFCDNYGDVNATSYGIGGIGGYMNSYGLVSGCNNYGNVATTWTGSYVASSQYGTGGIVGCFNYGTYVSNTYTLDSCNNYGNVSSGGYMTGGILGESYYYNGSTRKCYNYGKVRGTYYVGGITGFHQGCYTSTTSYAPYIISCANAGDVEGTYYVGGVVGRNGYSSYGYNAYVQECVNLGRVKGTNYTGGICGYNYGMSGYPAYVRGCLNAGIVDVTTQYAGGIIGYSSSTSYSYNQYNLNVANVICSGTYKGAVDGYSYAPTSCYFDSLMCPAQYYYYNTAATSTTGMRTSALTDGTFNPSTTYFTATSGLYPRPTSIANHPITILAATPVFLDETTSPTNHVENVNTCYTVGTRNNVSWTSSDPSQTDIAGSNGTVLAVGTPTITAHKDSITKEVDLDIVSMPAFNTFTYPAINDTIGHQLSGIRPSLSSGCTFFSNDLPEGLSINASTGEISGIVLDTINTTFTVISSCTGCRMYQATVSIHIVPDITCAGYTVTLPAGETWYYDREFTRPVGGSTAVIDSNTTFYARGLSGSFPTDYSYTGTVQQFNVPAGADSLKFQVWGAQGGWRSSTTYGGKGGYSEGTLTNLNGLSTLYVYVGGSGNSQTTMTSSIYPGGWNGGGYRYSYKGGGGATDISLQGTAGSTTWNSVNHLKSRIIVAGGGGSDGASGKMGMYGGGLTGGSSTENYTSVSDYGGKGGTQTYSGYSAAYTIATQTTTGLNANTTANYAGGFGFGGGGVYYSSGYGGAGGGGWYGGSGNVPDGSGDDDRGGGGGSGYVYTAASASNYPSGCLLNSNLYLTNAQTIGGDQSFEAPTGVTETGHEGNGYARITYYFSQCKYYIVNALPRVTAQISGDTTICNGTATLTLQFTGGAPYRYRITGDNADRTANSDLVTIQVSPTTSTLYYVTFVKSTVTGCEAVPDNIKGVGIVEVCGSSILCAGDTLTLPSGYTWYTDARLSNQVPGGIVYPRQNTTYYRSGASYNVVVLDRGTATILDTVYNVCEDSTAEVIINFTGLPPFTYRITGDRTDRVTSNYTERVPVTTDTSAIVKITYFSDLNTRCSGVISHSHAEIILCDQPIICYGDTVWLPNGRWFYDFNKTRPVTTSFIIPDQTTILYQSVNDTTDFDYTGNVQEYVVPAGVDSVIMQVWGAQGGGEFAAQYWGRGGKGGYATGAMAISPGTTLYVVVGQEGFQSATTQAYNGGGYGNLNTSSYGNGGTGGGATHIATATGILSSLSSNTSAVKIVAGGGGGAGGCTSPSYSTYAYNGGAGGGLNGIDGLGYSSTSRVGGGGGSQSAGGTSYAGSYPPVVQSGFGQGACVNAYTGDIIQGGGGGGGYYGGGCGFHNGGGGGGGSSYIAGLANASTVAGNASFPSPSGTAETGHAGDGYARIIARGSREFTILVLDNTVATMTDTTLNICNNQSANLEINFQGTPPFVYRITGDTADRTCNTHQAHVTVSPTITTNYQVTYVQGDICEGKTSSTYTTVMVCNQPIICAGDTAYLPSGSTWYYDQSMTQAIADTFVTPMATTTYYGNNNATFTVTVNPVATASILSNTYNVCDSAAVLELFFSGTTPFYYRITGDTADRVAYSDTVRIPVSPDTTTQYHITAFRDVYCSGFYNNDMATVIICDQPIICKGDTVWLDSTKTWFYDAAMLDTIRTKFVVPTQTTTYYGGGGQGGDTLNFRYTGSVQTYTIPRGVDSVFMQVWGAEGGGLINSGYTWFGGKGGYSQGKMAVRSGDVLSIYVGGRGRDGATGTGSATGGFNGGGSSANCTGTSTSLFHGGAGGGATDIRVNSTALNARAIVAGGGGGAGYGQTTSNTVAGGNGGGATGTDGICQTAGRSGYGASASAGGAGGINSGNAAGIAGTFGVGASSDVNGSYSTGGAGGGGWYGGGSGAGGNGWAGSGGGGSGFVYTSSNANCQLSSSYYLTNASTISGSLSIPDTSFRGTTETGHQGNGYARIYTIGPLTQVFRVTVKPSYSDTIRDTICAGASFIHNDSVYTVQGRYYQYFESYDHCDSIEVIEVTVNDTLRDTIHPIICTGVTFDTNGHLGCVPVSGQNYAPYWITGVYTQYLRDTATGCFHNLVIDLTVSDTIRDTVWHTICPSGHFTINGETYRDTGTFRQHLRTAGGCDSILAVIIDRSDTLRETIYRNMCFGSYFILNGETFNDTGTFKQHLNNVDGCDSILTLVLTYADTLRDTIHPIICAGDTFDHNGEKYFRTGLYNQYWLSLMGCDSLIYIDLTVRDTIFGHVYDTICAGASVTYNGETFTLPGDYHQILQATVHCDSFLTIHLHVNDTLRDTIIQTVCAGQTITVNDSVYWIQGEYKQWLRDAGTDCFHNYVIYLNVNDTLRDTIEPWICAGQVFRWNRVPYSVAGWYRQDFRTPEGCDSILHIHLIVGDTLRDTVYYSVCSGHTVTVNDQVFDSTGWYRQNLKNFDDCDSILHIHVTIEDTLRGHVYDTICYGDTYTFNGSTYYIPGIYPYVTTNREGCDSIAYLHLHVNDTIITHVYDTICRDGQYYFLDSVYDQTGDYEHLLYRTTGCDSTVVLHLFERDSIQSTIYDTICNNRTYNWDGRVLNQTGRYPKRLTSYTGCDSVVWLRLTVLDYPVLSILDSGAYCEGGFATLKANTTGNYITWSSSPYDPTMNGQDHNFTIYVSPDRYTEYTATVDIRPYNCRSTAVHAVNKPTKVEARMSMSPEEITAENLQCAFTDVSIGTIVYREWLFHERIPTIPDKLFYGDRTVNYTSSIENDTLEVRLIVVNDEGCYDTAVNLFPVFRGDVWVPNAFTPGRIGANRLLKVGHYNLIEYEIFIYTREGLLVFHSDDPEISWDGTYNYKDCKSGSYVYVVHYRTKSRPSESYEKKGSVLLIR